MKIREATILDLGRMTQEGMQFLELVSPERVPDEIHLMEVLRSLIDKGEVLVAEHEGEIAGGIGGIVANNLWFPDEQELVELFWWVAEDFRGSSAGLRLLKGWVDHGKSLGVKRIVMSDESVSPLSDDVYTKRGFELKQRSFIMEV